MRAEWGEFLPRHVNKWVSEMTETSAKVDEHGEDDYDGDEDHQEDEHSRTTLSPSLS